MTTITADNSEVQDPAGETLTNSANDRTPIRQPRTVATRRGYWAACSTEEQG